MWESLLDYSRLAWQATFAKALNNPGIIGSNALHAFDVK
jgi:hypothetical protein